MICQLHTGWFCMRSGKYDFFVIDEMAANGNVTVPLPFIFVKLLNRNKIP